MLLSLCSSTKSKKAQAALRRHEFTSVAPDKLAQAFIKISTADLLQIHRGHLKEADADALADKIVASLSGGEDSAAGS